MEVVNLPNPVHFENYEVIHALCRKYRLLNFGLGCEVGVREGFFSEFLLNNNSKLGMVLVDPYLPYLDLEFQYTQTEQDCIRERAVNRLSRFNGRAIWNNQMSIPAAEDYPDGSFDFVFIDAEHTFDSVKADIQAWKPKVRLGGMLCGHDFDMKPVQAAVVEFAKSINCDIYHVQYLADVWYTFL